MPVKNEQTKINSNTEVGKAEKVDYLNSLKTWLRKDLGRENFIIK